MNGDFSRIRFDEAQTYSRVLLNQGRMLLDAEVNAQSAIHHAFLRSLIVDLVGPAWRAGKDAFELAPILAGAEIGDFSIGKGCVYVHGRPCRNEMEGSSYKKQPFGPLPEGESKVDLAKGVFVILEVRERHVAAAQAPALRESALGNADGATREQIVWQARAVSPALAIARLEAVTAALELRNPPPGPEIQSVKDAKSLITTFTLADQAKGLKAGKAYLDASVRALPRLAAKAQEATVTELCALSDDTEYRGRENQLYRIEVHRGGPAKVAGDPADGATFKWSRDNGSVMLRIVPGSVAIDGQWVTVAVESLGHDRRTGLCENQWVEIACDAFEFSEAAHPLGRVARIDRAKCSVTLEFARSAPQAFKDPSSARGLVLQRWDHDPGDSESGAIEVVEGNEWIAVERGLTIRFAKGGIYRSGDYWLVTARVATGFEWPRDENKVPVFELPHGPQRMTAALGLASGNQAAVLTPFLEPLCPQTS